MRTLTILKAGALTTLQDSGRYGYQALGLTPAGAVDDFASKIVNWLVGNDARQAVLEMTLLGAKLRFESACRIALGGADMGALLNGQPLANWQSHDIAAGDVVSFGSAQGGCRSYLAVDGGFDCPLILNSRATDLRGQIGGLAGRALQSGDRLSFGKPTLDYYFKTHLPLAAVPDYQTEKRICTLDGPQFDFFTADARAHFYKETYRVAADSNRMALRLQGEALATRAGSDIISDPLVFGSIQVAGDGQPMLLMADRQTCGGYAKIATAVSSQRTVLAQLKPGDQLTFECVDIARAQQMLRHYQRELTLLKEDITRQIAIRYSEPKRYEVRLAARAYRVVVQQLIE